MARGQSSTNYDVFEKHQKSILHIKIAEFICGGLLLILLVLSIGFVMYIQFTANDQTYKTAAELCNTYTGIILGFVAMTVSLIGMILGFHNTKQSEQSNLDSIKEFTKLSDATDEIKRLEHDLSNKLTSFQTEINKLSELSEISKKLDSLVAEMQYRIDTTKGVVTAGISSVTMLKEEAPQSNFDDVNLTTLEYTQCEE